MGAAQTTLTVCASPLFLPPEFGPASLFDATRESRPFNLLPCKAGRLSQKAEPMKGIQGNKVPLILVAEDDEDNRFVTKTLLELRGYAVVEASNGQEAIDLMARAKPDLVLMDLKMPVLNGLAATRSIRQHAAASARRVPIVALSAYDPAQHRAVAMAAGCDDYVLKPVDYDRLGTLIESLLAGARAPAAAKHFTSGQLSA
jgi:CheY-like chemotaxis protein